MTTRMPKDPSCRGWSGLSLYVGRPQRQVNYAGTLTGIEVRSPGTSSSYCFRCCLMVYTDTCLLNKTPDSCPESSTTRCFWFPAFLSLNPETITWAFEGCPGSTAQAQSCQAPDIHG